MLKVLLIASLFSFAGEPAAPAKITADPPPGWTDVTAEQGAADVVLVLKGPETSSFVLTKVSALDTGNRAMVRSLLLDVLSALNRRTNGNFTLASNVQTQSFDNGLTAHYVKANADGKPRLILAVTDFGGEPLLGTLTSNVPDMILPSVLSGLRGPASTLRAGPGSSLDGQLAFRLPADVGARAVTERERKLGFVFAVVGRGSELIVQKLVEDIGDPKEQPQILRGTVLGVNGVDPKTYVAPRALPTPAGPELVYASADVAGGAQFAAGFLPWGFVGYSVLAKGPNAVELLVETFSTLQLGASASAKLVASSKRVPLSTGSRALPAAAAGAAILALAVSLVVWKRRRAV